MQRNLINNIDLIINKYTENKKNKTTIMISRVAMQICMNCGQNKHTNIDSRTRILMMMPRSQLFFNELFSSSLENQGRENISPTSTQSAANKKFI
jgi:hypothetical protein